MIPPILSDSCIDNGMFCCTHVVFKDAHSSYPLSFAINFLMQALISNASNFQRQKLENQAHTYMYTSTLICESSEYMMIFQKGSFCLNIQFHFTT